MASLALFVSAIGPLFLASQGGLTSDQVKAKFDLALRNGDGKLLHSVFRAGEMKGVTPTACTSFLREYVTPWYTKTGMEMGLSGKIVNWNDPKCSFMIVFKPTGGFQPTAVNKRSRVFDCPTIKEGVGYKSTVGFAQLLFTYAALKANGPKRNAIQEMEYGQQLVEKWIPNVKKLGIRGSIEPELNKFQSWDEVIRTSRAEVAKYKKQLGGKA